MSSELTLDPEQQAARVRTLLNQDTTSKKFINKLKAIRAQHPELSQGVDIVQAEGQQPARAGSGSAEPRRIDFTSLL